MFGPNMGTLEIEVFDGNSFTNIFTLTDNIDDIQEKIDLIPHGY